MQMKALYSMCKAADYVLGCGVCVGLWGVCKVVPFKSGLSWHSLMESCPKT